MIKRFSTKIIFGAALGCITFTVTWAQVDLHRPLAKDTTVTVGQLDNGLTYYIKPNAKPAQKVELRLVVKAGSILENDDQQGLAHFMEHMEFNGLKHYPKNELVDYLQKIGVRFGADLNANTGWDRTYFMLPIPTDLPDNTEKGFQIMSDWAGGALVTSWEVNDERRVILEELRMRNKNAQTRMMLQILPVMLNGSRYAYRLPGGKDSIVRYADPDLIRQFYRDWYRPDLMAVIVVGDITVAKAKTLIEKYFGDLKNPPDEKIRTYYEVAPYMIKKAMVVTDAEATGYNFALMYPAHRIQNAKTVGDFRKELVRAIFAQCLNRKLRDMAESDSPPFAGAQLNLSGSIGTITLQDEGMELDITPVDDLNASVDAAVGEMLAVTRFGFTDADILPVKNSYLSAYENVYGERNTTPSATFTDVLARCFMKSIPLVGIANEYPYVKELLPGITADDINAYARQSLNIPPNYFAMVTGPVKGKMPLPTDQGLLQIVDRAFRQQPKRNEEQQKVDRLLQQEPTPGKIVSELKDRELGTITYILSNGVKVTVKPTDFQQDQVLLSGVKYGGLNGYGEEDKSNTTFLCSVIGAMGYGKLTPAALSDFLSGKNIKITTGLTNIADEVHGSSSAKDMPTLLALTYLKLTQPRKDTGLLRGWYDKIAAQLPLLKADPQNAFRDSLVKTMYDNSPLTPIVIPALQDIDHINVDRELEIYREQFGNADGFHFFLLGNINMNIIRPLIERYLGSLPAKGIKTAYKDNGLRMVQGSKTFKFYKGTDQKSLILDMYHGDVPFSPALTLGATMLAQVMTIQMLDTIREKMQAIYSGGVLASVVRLPYSHYSIIAQLPCGPENVDRILKELDKEVAGYKQYGVSQTDLEKVKKAMTEQYQEKIKQNGTWLAALEQILFWGEDKDDFLQFKQRVNRMTANDLKSIADELLGNNHFTAITYPEHPGQ